MFNIETIENLAKVRGKDLISLYLNTDRRKKSLLNIKAKVKDLFKNESFDNKKEIEEKVFDFLDKISKNTKTVAIFVSKDQWSAFVFPFDAPEALTVDSIFNLEPVMSFLSENKSVGVLLIDSERTRFLSMFLGELEEHRYLEDQVVHRHHQGGWSQARFQRHEQDIVDKHLRRTLELLIKMHKFYKFEYLFLRSDPELENEFIKMLPKDLKQKLKSHIRVDIQAPASEIFKKVTEITKEEIIEKEKNLVDELINLLENPASSARVVCGLEPVLDALYNKRISTLLINEDYYEPGLYCGFCGYISRSEEFCPYDQTPNNRIKNILTVLIDEAIKQKVEIEVFKNDEKLKNLGDLAAFLKEH